MISDLDELVLSCRSEVSRNQMTEAVACYRAGAYRACIIATWIAVLFDFVSKLRELEMSGDKRAAQKLAEFDKARQNGDVQASLEFEKSLVKAAKEEFELLSPIEAIDLDRVYEDRNRCAHSSMVSVDEPYAPSGELARAHMKTAVSSILQHPPVQGKAALDRVFQDIKSAYFPRDEAGAYTFLRSGPLARARKPLIRSFAIGITKDLLASLKSLEERQRQFAALKAVSTLYPTEFKSAISDLLPNLISSISDEEFHLVIRFLRQIEVAWDSIGAGGQLRSVTFVRSAGADKLGSFINPALGIPALRSEAVSRIQDLSSEHLGKLIKNLSDKALVPRALDLLSKVSSYREAEATLEELILPLATELSSADIQSLADLCENDSQIQGAFRTPRILNEILKNSALDSEQTKQAWRRIYQLCLDDKFYGGQSSSLQENLQKRFSFEGPTPRSTSTTAAVETVLSDDDLPF